MRGHKTFYPICPTGKSGLHKVLKDKWQSSIYAIDSFPAIILCSECCRGENQYLNMLLSLLLPRKDDSWVCIINRLFTEPSALL